MAEENVNLEPAEEAAKVPEVKKAAGKPVKKQSRPGFFARLGKWFRDLRAEAKKVIWPTRKQVVNNTIVVIVIVIIVGAVVAGLDFVFGFVRDFLARILA